MANGIPTGGAPLFLGDFSKTTAAMGQRTTELLSQRLKEKRQQDYLESERTQQRLLEAMDFSAVEGLGRKAAMEHAKELNNFNQRWMKTYYERGNKLSTADFVKLNQEKSQLDQKIANYKHNVAQYAKYQQMVKENPHLWHPNTMKNLMEYKEQGNLGMDASKIMQPYFNMSKYLKNIDLDKRQIGGPVFSKDNQFYRIKESNREDVDRQIYGMLQDPIIAERMKDPYERQNILGQIQSFRQGNISESYGDYKPITSTMAKQMETAQLTPQDKEMQKLYSGSDLDMAYNYHFNNEIATRVRDLDREGLEYIRNSDPRVQSWKVLPDRTVAFYSVPRDQIVDPEKQTVYSFSYTPNKQNPTLGRMDVAEVYNTANLDVMTGKQVDKGMTKHLKRVVPDDMEIMGVTDYEKMKTDMVDPNVDRKLLAETINQLILDSGLQNLDKHGIQRSTYVGQMATRKGWNRFDLRTEAGRKKLDKWIREKVPDLKKQPAYVSAEKKSGQDPGDEGTPPLPTGDSTDTGGVTPGDTTLTDTSATVTSAFTPESTKAAVDWAMATFKDYDKAKKGLSDTYNITTEEAEAMLADQGIKPEASGKVDKDLINRKLAELKAADPYQGYRIEDGAIVGGGGGYWDFKTDENIADFEETLKLAKTPDTKLGDYIRKNYASYDDYIEAVWKDEKANDGLRSKEEVKDREKRYFGIDKNSKFIGPKTAPKVDVNIEQDKGPNVQREVEMTQEEEGEPIDIKVTRKKANTVDEAKQVIAKIINSGLSTPDSEISRLRGRVRSFNPPKNAASARDIYSIAMNNDVDPLDLFAEVEMDNKYKATPEQVDRIAKDLASGGEMTPVADIGDVTVTAKDLSGNKFKVEIGAKGTIPYRHNNPGNLQFIGQKGATKGEPREGVENFNWAKFKTPEEGFKALVRDIEAKQQGRTTTGLNKNSTVAEFVKIFADENEQKTKNYLSFLDKQFGIKSDDKIGDLDARYLAEAVARQESSSKILANK